MKPRQIIAPMAKTKRLEKANSKNLPESERVCRPIQRLEPRTRPIRIAAVIKTGQKVASSRNNSTEAKRTTPTRYLEARPHPDDPHASDSPAG